MAGHELSASATNLKWSLHKCNYFFKILSSLSTAILQSIEVIFSQPVPSIALAEFLYFLWNRSHGDYHTNEFGEFVRSMPNGECDIVLVYVVGNLYN